jgi:hypothetical protein
LYHKKNQPRTNEDNMKRAAIFIILWPALGALLLLAAGMYIQDKLNRAAVVTDLVLWGWLWGIVPACLCGLIDWFLARNLGPVFRIAAMVPVGFVITAVVIALGGLGVWPALLGGLVGIAPAVICSWLSGEKQRSGEHDMDKAIHSLRVRSRPTLSHHK